MNNGKLQLEDIVGRRTIIILNKYNIHNIEEFFDRCKQKYFWGKISNNIFIGDRIKLEKLLLNNRSVDTCAYYPPRSAEKRDYLIRYELVMKADGNLKITNSPYITYIRIVIDRLKREVEISLENDLNERTNTQIGVLYWDIEKFFEVLEFHKMKNIHAFSERVYSEKIVLTHISGNEDVFGPYDIIENVFDVFDFIKGQGVDFVKFKENLTNSKVNYDAIKDIELD